MSRRVVAVVVVAVLFAFVVWLSGWEPRRGFGAVMIFINFVAWIAAAWITPILNEPENGP